MLELVNLNYQIFRYLLFTVLHTLENCLWWHSFLFTRTQAEGDNKPKQTRTRRLSTQSNDGTDSKGTQPKSGKYYLKIKSKYSKLKKNCQKKNYP